MSAIEIRLLENTANISVRSVIPELGTELGIDYSALGVISSYPTWL